MVRRREEEKILDVNATMQGSLIFSDPVNLRINGKFEGDLQTKGVLQIGQYAEVKADIRGEIIRIAGRVTGTVVSERMISLLSTAVVQANLSTPALEIQEGAIFEGKSSMIADTMQIKDISRYLDIEEDKILEWATAGKIPAIQDGDKWVFERKRIENWVKETK
ncbi:polymer-forming cytoskeletal protein [Candidatus Omnitrophota bacterium]